MNSKIKTHCLRFWVFLCFLSLPVWGQQSGSPEQGVVQLEATIRGNKEQPKVLSIVPWQLPSHRSIDYRQVLEASQIQFQPLERKQFLHRLSLTNRLAVKTHQLSKEQ